MGDNEFNNNKQGGSLPIPFKLLMYGLVIVIILNLNIFDFRGLFQNPENRETTIKASYNFTETRTRLLFDIQYTRYSTKEGILYIVTAEPVDNGYGRYDFTQKLTEPQFNRLIGVNNNGVWLTVEAFDVIFNDGERTFTAKSHTYKELDGYVKVDDEYKLDIQNRMIDYLTDINEVYSLDDINELMQEVYPNLEFDTFDFIIPSSSNVEVPDVEE